MRNDNCTNCGGFGYTVEYNGEEEFMNGCFECYVAAQEAEVAEADTGTLIDMIMAKNPGVGIVDIAKMTPAERLVAAA